MQEVVIVVPCYNEAERLDEAGFEPLFQASSVSMLFVDDGSTDDTKGRLLELQSRHAETVDVLFLEKNSGKAEAVRRGLLHAMSSGAKAVGYLDADLATPAIEMVEMIGELGQGRAKMILGARVRLLGRQIERQLVRHYLGRVFATAASWALGMAVYDTQCGAKLIRSGPALEAALALPFRSRWAFDVELIGRLRAAPIEPLRDSDFLEHPLQVWIDKAGSKFRPLAMVRAGFDLMGIAWALRSRSLI